jgi:hypothetical protein
MAQSWGVVGVLLTVLDPTGLKGVDSGPVPGVSEGVGNIRERKNGGKKRDYSETGSAVLFCGRNLIKETP